MQNQNIEKSNFSTKWIEHLALEEINMEESGIINMDEHLDPTHFLEQSSIEFMNDLRDRFDFFISKFNDYRGQGNSGQIKVFKISNTVNDFMLFRNSLRLIFARKAYDIINIGFLSSGKDLFGARLEQNDSFGGRGAHQIRAHVGPFHNVSWKFQGEPVEVDALVRHYLSEFIRNSAS